MTWRDRAQEAAITSPSGNRFTFQYEDLERSSIKKGTVYEFPNFDGSLVVDSGRSSKRYPMRCFFSGDNHDLEANDFESAVLESGVLTLEHPIFGTVNAVCVGEITRSDARKTAANQTVIELEFLETILDFYPLAGVDYSQQIAQSVEDLTAEAADNFPKPPSRAAYKQIIKETSNSLRSVSDGVAGVQSEFDDIENDLNKSLETFIIDPINIGFQTLRLIQSPGRVLGNLQARLEAAGNLLNSLIGSAWDYNKDLNAVGALQLASLSAINSDLKIRSDATNASDTILNMLDSWRAWRESAGNEDNSEIYDKTLSMVSLTAAYLIEISFSLIPEKRVTLEESRAVIELCIELYGDLELLDFFITSNDFTVNEILEIPRGREIVYYI